MRPSLTLGSSYLAKLTSFTLTRSCIFYSFHDLLLWHENTIFGGWNNKFFLFTRKASRCHYVDDSWTFTRVFTSHLCLLCLAFPTNLRCRPCGILCWGMCAQNSSLWQLVPPMWQLVLIPNPSEVILMIYLQFWCKHMKIIKLIWDILNARLCEENGNRRM